MSDFAIDPELRIRAKPEMVLRRTKDAVLFIREMVLSRRGHQWLSGEAYYNVSKKSGTS
jgi:hypothetical protein